jgi:hypothetical protein
MVLDNKGKRSAHKAHQQGGKTVVFHRLGFAWFVSMGSRNKTTQPA